MIRLFVTGTDTDVGKTHVTATLARLARAAGRTVAACKPVASGVEPGSPGDDAIALGAAAGHPPLGFATFVAPLSPHRAALLEGRALPADLMERVAALRGDVVLVEGAGGWRVPLNDREMLSALAVELNLPVIQVVGMKLGCISHALLTAEAIQADGLRYTGTVADCFGEMDVREENLIALRQHLPGAFTVI